ncbi:carbamoyltransferase [Clostridium polyendosporum]|uniref:Carbamoyltransferase n=1 Tax=Clostridium polyendosporum TaxID=69208 RepID=A0A919RWV0_9CLOT|nr:carbamoyltransferase HypF [Clostridium polyendosporum]GIM27742.1 carbamoyltransferase [Clostridium polyendosporum]
MKKLVRKYIIVKGIVQGVGFRPFVYNEAIKNNLTGWVKNTSEGVCIDIEGQEREINVFLEELNNNSPILSKIEEICVQDRSLQYYKEFIIDRSCKDTYGTTFISPDVAICKDCEKEITDSNNRRYEYPFTNCTSCGPRFSIIKKLPYDRSMTTMGVFKMCSDCSEEYESPIDRRFHAQPNACNICGPKVWLTDKYGNFIESTEPIKKARLLLKEGKIIAVKGIGGFHLICDGKNEKVIQLLRDRKGRSSKPFALMMKDIETIRSYCYVNDLEERILIGIRRPILLLDKKNEQLPNKIAFNNNKLGVMLPYTPLHHLLFDEELTVLIMTSANVSGLPIIYKNDEALESLKDVVDYFLLHDREIHVPVDDSVSRVVLGKECVIRRSRGYAPAAVRVEDITETLACGANLKNSFCISKKQFAFLSQHIGDLENLETYKSLENNIKHFKNIYNIQPKLIAHDLHPNFLSTDFAQKEEGVKVPVQHHHAHVVSCMVENKINTKVIGIAFDGTGYGTDGKIWGGEFLICDYLNFERVGHLKYVKMPGGDAAAKEPWRMALSYIYHVYGDEFDINMVHDVSERDIKNIIMMLKHNMNCPETSSMGRLFDAVSALLAFKRKITFEGEAAIELEILADLNDERLYSYGIDTVNGVYIVNTDLIIRDIIKDMKNQVSTNIIAKRFHNTVVAFSIEICRLIRNKYNISSVVLSGGVFQNEILLKGLYKVLMKEGFEVYTHGEIPCNDGGIAVGQLMIANYKYKNREE